MGLDIYLKWKGQTEEEHKAQITGFKNTGECGYLRSSYNSGGFNSWAERTLGGHDLYWIFGYSEGAERDTGEYDEDGEPDTGFFPDWAACRARASEALEAARKLDNHYAIPVSVMWDWASDEDHALEIFHGKADNHQAPPWATEDGGHDWFSCREGEFFLGKPPVVKAVIPTKPRYGMGGVVLVCEAQDGKSPHSYYIDMLENHVLPFIDTGERRGGWMHWSG